MNKGRLRRRTNGTPEAFTGCRRRKPARRGSRPLGDTHGARRCAADDATFLTRRYSEIIFLVGADYRVRGRGGRDRAVANLDEAGRDRTARRNADLIGLRTKRGGSLG